MSEEDVGPGSSLVLEVSEGDPPGDWDRFLVDGLGSPFHASVWARHKSYGGAGDPLYFTWRSRGDGVEVGRALAIRRPSRRSRLGRLASRAVFDSSPAARMARADFVSPLSSWAKTQPALLEARLGSLDARSAWAPGPLPNSSLRREYVIPAGTEQDVWKGMNRNARRNVKRAQKAGLETRLGTIEDARGFARIYRSTLERLQKEKGIAYQFDDEAFAAGLAPLFENDFGRLYVSGRDRSVECGWFFIAMGDTACAVYSGTTDAGREVGGNSLSLYDALCDLRRGGFPRLNLGGAEFDAPEEDSLDHGLHLYKTRFGANGEERAGGAVVIRPLRTRLVDGARKLTGR